MSQTRQSRGLVRVGISLPDHVYTRMKELTEFLGVSQSELIETFVSTLGAAEMKRACEAMHELRKLEEVLHRKTSADMLRLVRGKTADQIKQMTLAASQALDNE